MKKKKIERSDSRRHKEIKKIKMVQKKVEFLFRVVESRNVRTG